ncbi:MAG: histone deacetylase [Candidatus Bathyarchaeia archaeon]
MDRIGIVYNEKINQYDFGYGHPFSGSRFSDYIQILKEKKIHEHPNVTSFQSEAAVDNNLLLAHSKEYIEFVETQADLGLYLSPDTPVTPRIVEAARYIVGGAVKAAELANTGYSLVDSVGGGLHHAGRDYGGGFCVFNDVAICALALLENYGFDRVLILDTDVHTGNGTMDIFWNDPRVLFVDLHQDPRTIYPGKGFLDEIGEADGRGYTVNIPLPRYTGDQDYLYALDRVFKPLVEQFEPQVIIRNGGSDPHFGDRLGSLNLSYKGLHNISATVREAALEIGASVINMSCSGYNSETVAKGWYAILAGLINEELDIVENNRPIYVRSQREAVIEIIDELANNIHDYWTL